MAWFCGGHGVCLTNPGTTIDVGVLALAWMQHWVARNTSVPVLHGIAFVDQDGTGYAAPSYPPTVWCPVHRHRLGKTRSGFRRRLRPSDGHSERPGRERR